MASTETFFQIMVYAEQSSLNFNLLTTIQHRPFEALVVFDITKNRMNRKSGQ